MDYEIVNMDREHWTQAAWVYGNLFDENIVDDLRRFAWKIENQMKDTDIVLSSILFNGEGKNHSYCR